VEGHPLPLLIQIGQYYEIGCWTFEEDDTSYTVSMYILNFRGGLFPGEMVGYPDVFPDRIEFRYYGAEALRAARQASLAALPAGFARMREKKMAKVVGRPLPLELVLGCILPFL